MKLNVFLELIYSNTLSWYLEVNICESDGSGLKGPPAGQNAGLDPGGNEKTVNYSDTFERSFHD